MNFTSRRNKFAILVLMFIVCLNTSCHRKRNLDVDVSDVDVGINIKRYGKTLFSIDQHNLQKSLMEIQSEFSLFLDADLMDTMNVLQIRDYLNDPVIITSAKASLEKYSDVEDIKTLLTNAYKHYKYYFPSRSEPIVYTYISGLDYEYPIKMLDNNLIIALDMYLGDEFLPYTQIGLPTYMTKWMTEDLIVVDCMSELAKMHLREMDVNSTLLDKMLYHGKILYFIDAMLPDLQDSLKIKYSENQLIWAQMNEVNIWSFFVENKLLYSTDYNQTKQFILDGPFTSSFSKESPARLGYFIGWQIVKNYMDNSKDIEIKQIFEESDSQNILKKSKYKPRKPSN